MSQIIFIRTTLLLSYQFLHGRVGFVANVIHPPHLGIDGAKAERKAKRDQPQPKLQREEEGVKLRRNN